MTPEETKTAAAVMLAHANGAKVQWRYEIKDGSVSSDWAYLENPSWNFESYYYRLALTPKLRPWKPEEVPVGAVLRWKNMPLKRVLITGTDGEHVFGAFTYSLNKATHAEVFEKYEHSNDGGKTWLPCGVMEDAL
jgi:hypothetical protein